MSDPSIQSQASPESPESKAERLRGEILALVREYHEVALTEPEFEPGVTQLRYAGRVFDHEEVVNLVDSGLDFWLTTGRFAKEFEKRFARLFGLRHALLVNSGSSANLLALTTLTSPELGERRLRRGDEVISVACGFPTTVNPIIHNGLVPVFCDVHVPTYNIDVSQLEEARSDRTRAVMVAHTLGNPFDLGAVRAFCDQHDLWLMEDCCDAVGSTYDGRSVGSFGDLATVTHVYELIGGMIVHLVDSIHRAGRIELVSMRHEQAAPPTRPGAARASRA